jgi:acetyl esterase/lipase
MFFYGGGFVQGHRTLPIPTLDGLVHANVASFFARNFGYTVVIPDYRLLSHGAEFPSGGEDVALAVKWVSENIDKLGVVGEEAKHDVDLFVLGNSAGGVHVSTYLFHDQYKEMRANVLGIGSTRLRGVVMLSVPFSYDQLEDEAQRDVLEKYFGAVERNCPVALMQDAYRSQQGELDFVKSKTRILVLNAEWDPKDEFLGARDKFVREWSSRGGAASKDTLIIDSLARQNHISPFLGLGTEIENEEAWGCRVAKFCEASSCSDAMSVTGMCL